MSCSFWFNGLLCGSVVGRALSKPGVAAALAATYNMERHEDVGYKALPSRGAFPGLIVKFTGKQTWWGLAIPWRAMASPGYKLSGVLQRQEDVLHRLYQWLHGEAPGKHDFQLQRHTQPSETITDDVGVSSFTTTRMFVCFLVWASTSTPVSCNFRIRDTTSYNRSREVVVNLINCFCALIPHPWTIDLGELGGEVRVVHGLVDLSTVRAVAALETFWAFWQVLQDSVHTPWCVTGPPHAPLGEFVGVCFMAWKQDPQRIWDGLLHSVLRKLSKVLDHYARYVACERYLQNLPKHGKQKSDSLMLCQWLRQLLRQDQRRDLPACPMYMVWPASQPTSQQAWARLAVAAKRMHGGQVAAA